MISQMSIVNDEVHLENFKWFSSSKDFKEFKPTYGLSDFFTPFCPSRFKTSFSTRKIQTLNIPGHNPVLLNQPPCSSPSSRFQTNFLKLKNNFRLFKFWSLDIAGLVVDGLDVIAARNKCLKKCIFGFQKKFKIKNLLKFLILYFKYFHSPCILMYFIFLHFQS